MNRINKVKTRDKLSNSRLQNKSSTFHGHYMVHIKWKMNHLNPRDLTLDLFVSETRLYTVERYQPFLLIVSVFVLSTKTIYYYEST